VGSYGSYGGYGATAAAEGGDVGLGEPRRTAIPTGPTPFQLARGSHRSHSSHQAPTSLTLPNLRA
jgi:hypothetical protein